ncbi:hypothetical protein DPV78_006201, partial [Talaromyces pinophilus]
KPIGLASGVLSLAVFAFQCSKVLYETVQSFHSHPQRVRDLLQELKALNAVLNSLTDIVRVQGEADLPDLKIPLLRCGKVCEDFKKIILRCSSTSGTDHKSFRGGGGQPPLSFYISFAFVTNKQINLSRTSTVTAERVDALKKLVSTAKDDLEAHLDKRLSTEKCLQICSQLAEHIDQIRPTLNNTGSSPGSVHPEFLSERATNASLHECQNNVTQTATELERHLKHLIDRLLTKSKSATCSEEELMDLIRPQDEWEAARHVIENYATGRDTYQFMISTDGKNIHGKNEGNGTVIRQMGGHMSDAAAMQISQDTVQINSHSLGYADLSQRGDTAPPLMKKAEVEPTVEFSDRHGRGLKLGSEEEIAISSPLANQGRKA